MDQSRHLNLIHASDLKPGKIKAWLIENVLAAGKIMVCCAKPSHHQCLVDVIVRLAVEMSQSIENEIALKCVRFGTWTIAQNAIGVIVDLEDADTAETRLNAAFQVAGVPREASHLFLSADDSFDARKPDDVTALIEKIKNEVRERYGTDRRPDYVIFNSLNLIDPDGKGMDDRGPVLSQLRRIARELGCAIIILHAMSYKKETGERRPAGDTRVDLVASAVACLEVSGNFLTLDVTQSSQPVSSAHFRRKKVSVPIDGGGVSEVFSVVPEDAPDDNDDNDPALSANSRPKSRHKGVASTSMTEAQIENAIVAAVKKLGRERKVATILFVANIPAKYDKVARRILQQLPDGSASKGVSKIGKDYVAA